MMLQAAPVMKACIYLSGEDQRANLPVTVGAVLHLLGQVEAVMTKLQA